MPGTSAAHQQRDVFTQAGRALASYQVQNEEQTPLEGLSGSAMPAPCRQPFGPGEAEADSSAALPATPSTTALISASAAAESSFLQKTLLQLSPARLGSPTDATSLDVLGYPSATSSHS